MTKDAADIGCSGVQLVSDIVSLLLLLLLLLLLQLLSAQTCWRWRCWRPVHKPWIRWLVLAQIQPCCATELLNLCTCCSFLVAHRLQHLQPTFKTSSDTPHAAAHAAPHAAHWSQVCVLWV